MTPLTPSCMYIAQIYLGTQEQSFRLSYGVDNDHDHVEPQEHSIVATYLIEIDVCRGPPKASR